MYTYELEPAEIPGLYHYIVFYNDQLFFRIDFTQGKNGVEYIDGDGSLILREINSSFSIRRLVKTLNKEENSELVESIEKESGVKTSNIDFINYFLYKKVFNLPIIIKNKLNVTSEQKDFLKKYFKIESELDETINLQFEYSPFGENILFRSFRDSEREFITKVSEPLLGKNKMPDIPDEDVILLIFGERDLVHFKFPNMDLLEMLIGASWDKKGFNLKFNVFRMDEVKENNNPYLSENPIDNQDVIDFALSESIASNIDKQEIIEDFQIWTEIEKKGFVVLDFTNDNFIKEIKMILAAENKDKCLEFLKKEKINYSDILQCDVVNFSEIECKSEVTILVDLIKFNDFIPREQRNPK